MPGLDFHELKHRAIQWMIDPVADGGLGLDSATAAEIIGHDDGGYLISTVSDGHSLARRRLWRPISDAKARTTTPRLGT
jgi:hypothetical protein